ncbi:type II toxin-antitoxin system RelE family toxin [Sulfuricurvum sp.]|uniref:type II toxin-antitoxin system RelE family toxin n=1 Tax=Sulfuricurvum sp. TaxID=2025608 RepID=UPI003BB4ACD9
MASYKIEIKKSAAKEIENLPSVVLKRVVSHIQELGSNPRLIGCKKLSGDEKYRIRVGDYRILYEIEDEIVSVYVVKVAH